MQALQAEGIMGDLDDGPEQNPLDKKKLEETILHLLPQKHYDLIITHNPSGEYTQHARHEEVSRAVIKLWEDNVISAKELWIFAYEDGNKRYFPLAVENATSYQSLPNRIWQRKFDIITEIYGFGKDSWEAETTPKAEAFWKFSDPEEAKSTA